MSTFLIISTAWAIIALVLLVVAWWLAHAGRTKLHSSIMILLTVGAWTFVISYLFTQRYTGNAEAFPREYVPWIAVHGSLGLVPLIGATCLVFGRLLAGRNKFSIHFNRHHRMYGRGFIIIWCFTHLGGIFNAFFLHG